jgi:outer membrane lipoprotein-sorting protein
MWLDGKLWMPVRMRYEEGDGDFTDYVFSDLKLNVEIPDDRFSVALPADVAVTDAFSQPEADEKDEKP